MFVTLLTGAASLVTVLYRHGPPDGGRGANSIPVLSIGARDAAQYELAMRGITRFFA